MAANARTDAIADRARGERSRMLPAWPEKYEVIGVPVSRTNYQEATECLLAAAREWRPALATALAVHGLVVASEDGEFRRRLRDFALVTPDGQPIRIALNLLYGAALADRVYGPQLMLNLCERAAESGVGVYLYGSGPETIARLQRELGRRFPALAVVGAEPSAFRPLTPTEDAALVERIHRSGAGLLFLGLGCPLQETFAHQHRDAFRVVQVCVGAAFDFLSGTKRMAPRWMQDHALEWAFRLSQEPGRLVRRYAETNNKFLFKFALQATGLRYRQPMVED